MKDEKDEKILKRHRTAYKAAHLLSFFPLLPYTCRCEKAPELTEPCLILSNHLTEADLFILMRSFPEHMYFVCGEHLYRGKFGPLFGKYFAPIPAARGASMLPVVAQILRKLKSGHHVMMFPEGSRSFNGVTMQVDPAIGKLVKKAGCGLVTYKIIGGYFAAPRWAYTARKGHLAGHIRHIYTSAELKNMSAEEITDRINRDIHEDAYKRQRKHPYSYRSQRRAEGLENYLEICPACGAYDSMTAKGSDFRCESCGLAGTYDEYGFLHASGEKELPFDNVRDWGYWMEKQFDKDMKKRLEEEDPDRPLFTEQKLRLYQVDAKNHTSCDIFTDATMRIYRDRMEIGEGEEEKVFDFGGISACSMLYFGKTWLFTHRSGYFGITGEKFHAWKLDRLFKTTSV